jgi:hypothetical protein
MTSQIRRLTGSPGGLALNHLNKVVAARARDIAVPTQQVRALLLFDWPLLNRPYFF